MLQYFSYRGEVKIKDICLLEIHKAFVIGNYYNVSILTLVIERREDKIKDICLFEIHKAFLIGNYYNLQYFSCREA